MYDLLTSNMPPVVRDYESAVALLSAARRVYTGITMMVTRHFHSKTVHKESINYQYGTGS